GVLGLALVATVAVGCSDDEPAGDGASGGDVSAGASSTTTTGSGPAGSPLEAAAGQEVEPSGDASWPTHGHDLGAQRWNGFETVLGPDEASSLEPVWEVDDLLAVTGTPAVVDGVVYVTEWTGGVRALDAETGEERWATEVDGEPAGSPTV